MFFLLNIKFGIFAHSHYNFIDTFQEFDLVSLFKKVEVTLIFQNQKKVDCLSVAMRMPLRL